MLSPIKQNVARMIHKKGSFKFGVFRLKLHETNPHAPLSPFFINIRNKDNPTKPGELENRDYDLIARCLLEMISENHLKFDAIAGIPRAGDPIVDAIQRLIDSNPFPHPARFRIIKLAKEEIGDTRKIVPMPDFEYREEERILLVDDLVTKAHTKLEAISAIEEFGSKVVGLVVLVDREQGGREQIEAAGYKMFAALTISELLDFYVQEELVDKGKYQEAINYVKSV